MELRPSKRELWYIIFYPLIGTIFYPILNSQQRLLLILLIVVGVLLQGLPILIGSLRLKLIIKDKHLIYSGYFVTKTLSISELTSVTNRQIYILHTTTFFENGKPNFVIWNNPGFSSKQINQLLETLKLINPHVTTRSIDKNSRVSDAYNLGK